VCGWSQVTWRKRPPELDRVMNEEGINNEDYQPSVLGTFHAFAEEWKQKVVSTMGVTTQAGCKSELKSWDSALQIKHGAQSLSAPFRELNSNVIQTVISGWNMGEKASRRQGRSPSKPRGNAQTCLEMGEGLGVHPRGLSCESAAAFLGQGRG
jgi:hypothetical protein